MSRVEELRAEAQKLHEQADKTADRDRRFEIILKAMVLESEAEALGGDGPPSPSQPEAGRQVAQQQQQPRLDDDRED
jgi:hypothetical protein